MNKIIDITPNYKFTSSRDKVIDNPILDMGTTISGVVGDRLVSTVNSAINQAGNLVTDVVNVRLDTSSKKILSDFTFGVVDYAGAVKTGDIAWNSVTGAITGGSGVVVYRKGIVGASAGVVTFSIDATTGDATFAGTLAAAAGTLGTITAGTLTGLTINTGASGNRIAISSSIGLGSLAGLNFYNQDGTSIATLNATNSTILFDATSPNTASRMFQFIQFIQNGSNLNPMVYLEAKDVSTGTTPLEIQQRGDKTSLKIQNYNTSAGISLTIDNAGTANSIDISASGASGVGLNLALSGASNNDDGIVISHAGTGRGIMMNLTEAISGSPAIEINNDGGGRGIYIHNDKTTGSGYGIYLVHAGTNSPLVIEANNATADNGTAVIQAYQASIYQLHYKKLIDFTTVRIWMSDGTAPNAVGNQLSGVVGDICLNCDGGKTYYCTGTTNWTAM